MGWVMGKTEISAGGDAGCGEVTELELSDRNDAKAFGDVKGQMTPDQLG